MALQEDIAVVLDRLSLSGQKSAIRSLLSSVGTDLSQYESDPYGNGDQSNIQTMEKRDKARKLFSCGGDIHQHAESGAFSEIAFACIAGNVDVFQKALNKTLDKVSQPHSRSDQVKKVLESRETSLRLSPLLLIVSAGKHMHGGGMRMDHAKVAKLLLKAGASPDCKDVLGKTVVHYGAGSMATGMTIQVADMCIRAAQSSNLHGQDVELFGLKSADMNGTKGVAGGFDPDSGRRAVYVPELKKEVWAKPINIRLVVVNETATSTTTPDDKKEEEEKPMLANVQDRLGSISLHEVVMTDRMDVAELLLKKHNTSIHINDLDGVSALTMATTGGSFMQSEVCRMISDITRRQAKQNRDAKKGASKTCAKCNKDLGKDGGMKCSKCLVTLYCGRDCQVAHWKEAHKVECENLSAHTSGVKLSKAGAAGGHTASFSFSSLQANTSGAYRNPRGVNVGDKFVVKVQGGSDVMPLMVYDETRTCEFHVLPTEAGFHEIVKAVRAEPAWGGRKTFMKASFDSSGECTVYPATAGVKNKYSW